MLRNSTSIVPVLFFFLSTFFVYASPTDIDSTQSSIDFVKMEVMPSQKIVHFKWDVNAESRGDHFIIEKSTDKKKWKSISKVESLKNHKNRHTYMVSEFNQAEGAHEFFRIKRVDKQGYETILDLVDVNQPVLTSLVLIPNSKAENKQMVITYSSLIFSRGVLTVFNLDGETIYEERLHLKSGYNRLVVDTRKYEKGNYIVVVQDEYDNRLTKSFALQNKKARKSKF